MGRVFWVFKFCSSWVLNRTFVWHSLVNFVCICQWISNISFFLKNHLLGLSLPKKASWVKSNFESGFDPSQPLPKVFSTCMVVGRFFCEGECLSFCFAPWESWEGGWVGLFVLFTVYKIEAITLETLQSVIYWLLRMHTFYRIFL